MSVLVIDEADLVLSYGGGDDVKVRARRALRVALRLCMLFRCAGRRGCAAPHNAHHAGVCDSLYKGTFEGRWRAVHNTTATRARLQLDDLRRLVLHNPAVLRLEEADAAAGRDGVAGGGTLSQFYVRVPLVDRYLLCVNLIQEARVVAPHACVALCRLFALLKLRLLAGKTLIFTACLDTALRMRLVLERFSVAAAVLNAELPANSRRHIIAQVDLF